MISSRNRRIYASSICTRPVVIPVTSEGGKPSSIISSSIGNSLLIGADKRADRSLAKITLKITDATVAPRDTRAWPTPRLAPLIMYTRPAINATRKNGDQRRRLRSSILMSKSFLCYKYVKLIISYISKKGKGQITYSSDDRYSLFYQKSRKGNPLTVSRV